MKNKSKEFELLLLYDILAASDCLCSAYTVMLCSCNLVPTTPIIQPLVDRLLQKPVKMKINMKNKSKEYKLLLLYDRLTASDCSCSASHASAT